MSIAAFAMVAAVGVLTLPNEVAAQERPAMASNVQSRSALLQRKLKSIIIDKVNFDKLDVIQAIGFLQKKSKELDPDKEGINFVVRLTGSSADHFQIHREVSMVLEDVSLRNLLDEIARQTNLKYSVDDYAIYFRPAVDDYEKLSVRTFSVPANFLDSLPVPVSTGQ